jgi:hypothetical protein
MFENQIAVSTQAFVLRSFDLLSGRQVACPVQGGLLVPRRDLQIKTNAGVGRELKKPVCVSQPAKCLPTHKVGRNYFMLPDEPPFFT